MPLNLAMSVMNAVEILLWATLAYLFWSRKLQRRFPAMGAYLVLRACSTPLIVGAIYIQEQPWGRPYYPLYFYGFYTIYIASAILLFFVCTEIFRSALSGFSGLIKFGAVIFRWAALASVMVSLSTLSFAHRGSMVLPDLGFGLMRSVSVLELCLLAFLCLAMNALQLSIRDLAFGLAAGFGILSANDFITASLASHNMSLNAPVQLVYQSVVLLCLGIWVAYAVIPQTERRPVVVAANSTIYRWNEIASALGHKGANVAVPATANGFFLSDVEKVVDKVLTRNLRENESES